VNSPLVDTWTINARLNKYLAEALTDAQWCASLDKGKSVNSQFAHIHNVRLMWLQAAAPGLHEGQVKLDPKTCTRDAMLHALDQSADGIARLIAEGEASGKIKGFKPHPHAFVGYLIAHEAHHRAQIELALRQAGIPLDDKIAYGLWEWGSR
jgi:uncharacterized damage-inducible protein DinB